MSKKTKVVIDTGVLVSALWSAEGSPASILKLIPDDIVPHINNEILSEYKEVLNRPKFDFTEQKKTELLSKMEMHSEQMMPMESNDPMPDESDRIFYDTAKQSGAILITGNTKHFPDEPFIVTPAVFINKMKDT